jgi:hypothetical protein
MNITKLFGLSKKTNTDISSFYDTIYPEGVRYALRYNEAKLGASEIESLINSFTYEALYLTIKAFDDPEEKRKCIEAITRIYADPNYRIEMLKRYLYTRVKEIPPGASAAGAKLAQLNRSGSDNWQAAFRNLAQTCYNENKTALPCLIAYTTMLGYHHFVQIYRQLVKSHICILVPNWMIDPDSEFMGYNVQLGKEVHVEFQPKDECLIGAWTCLKTNCRFAHHFCGTTFFIDDTISTSTTARKVQSFWHSEYGLRIPEERIRVVTDLRP